MHNRGRPENLSIAHPCREEHSGPAPDALYAPPASISAGLKGCAPGLVTPLLRFNPGRDKQNDEEEEVEGKEEEEEEGEDREGGSPSLPFPPETWS